MLPSGFSSLRPRVVSSLVALLVVALWGDVSRAVVISEIMYHSSELEDQRYEYIELYNENLDPLDLGGFRLTNGASFEFPEGTWLDGHSFLVVCADTSAIEGKYGIANTVGNWVGALSNGGEKIELANPGGVTVATVSYDDRGEWPAGADGTGFSLSLSNPFVEVDDADNWFVSSESGGTPGRANSDTFQTGGGAPSSSSGLDGNGFILWWLVLGPYTDWACNQGVARLAADWLREGTGGVEETDLVWRDGQVVDTDHGLAESAGLHANAGAALPTIKEYRSFSDTIDLNDGVWPPDPSFVMAYSFVYVDNVTEAPLAVDIACASDDAIAVLLNGSLVHSNDACRGVGNPGEVQDRAPATLAVGKNLLVVKVFEQQGGWSFRLRLEDRGTGQAITRKSKIQITTDPDAGLRFGGGGTPIEHPDEDPPPPPEPGTLSASPVAINEGYLRTAAPWIELYNRTSADKDLSGYHITSDPGNLVLATLPAGTTLPARGYLVLTAAELGLDLSLPAAGEKRFVALVSPDAEEIVDAANFAPGHDGFSEARLPDGDSELSDGADPTPGAPNVDSAGDAIVINELMYHPIDGNDDKEYIELFNRGTTSVDLGGWRFSNGVSFGLPSGAIVPAGGYLVVGRNPALLRSIYGLGGADVVGPEDTAEAREAFGRLRDSGERVTLKDAVGRTVDTLRYHDGGEWPRWPDGFGSSMERVDPYADGRIGQAWDASDDSGKAETREYSYVGRHRGGESELDVLLLARGITVVDDVSVIGGGTQTTDVPLVDRDEEWRYLKGTAEPPADWKALGFDDGAWLRGPTGIGYGDGDDATSIDDMQGSYLTVFCRKTFTIDDPAAVDELVLGIVVDDGFHAYLNGTQVASYNVSGTAFDAPASSAIEPTLVERDISSQKGLLHTGTNVLAVQVHNANLSSSDSSFIPRLVSRTTTVVGGSEQVQNGTFEANATGWMIEGTHIRSGRTTLDPISGAGSLKIVSSGRGDNKVNRIETPEASGTGLGVFNADEDLLISFKARWVVGSQTLLTHGYAQAMAKAHSLAVPPRLGTPGATNSVTERLIAEEGEANLGPLIADVVQDPAVPGAGEDVTVTARVADPDGVASVTLRYSLTNPTTTMTAVAMTPAGGGYYRGTIPGQVLGTRVVFFLAATDSSGHAGRYPLDVHRRTHPLVLDPRSPNINDHQYCVYRHDVKDPATPYHSYRFWMTQAKEDELSGRKVHSNDLVQGSFVYGSQRIYHTASMRFSGSPFLRGGWGGTNRVAMPRDDWLHGRTRKFNLDVHGADGRERISHYLIRQNQGNVGVPYFGDQTLVRWQVNDRIGGSIVEHVCVPDAQYLSLWYPDDDKGNFFELDDRFTFNDAGGMTSNADARVLYPPPSATSDGNGENKENYRFFFGLRAKNGADDYSSLIDLAHLLDPSVTPDAALEAVIFQTVNVEEMLRVWAVRLNTDDWDEWGASRGKNCYLYRPAVSGLWELLPWDMELTYGGLDSYLIPASPTDAFHPGGFSEVNRLLNLPSVRRMYYGILTEMVVDPGRWFHSSRLETYMQKLAAVGVGSTDKGMPGGFIDQRAARIEPRIRAVVYPQVRLTVTTNGGNDFSTAATAVDLAGTTPVEVSHILVSDNGDEGSYYATSFPSMTTWSIRDVLVVPGANELTMLGLDLHGNLVDSDTIRIASTAAPWNPPAITGVDPEVAPAGVEIEVLGTGLHDGLRVFFGTSESTAVSYDESGDRPDRIVARVPSGSGLVLVTVRNRDGKTSAGVPFTYAAGSSTFIRGDANGDFTVDLSDGVRILLHLFAGRALDCQDAADVDDDELLGVTDPIYLFDYLFKAGTAPRAPYPGEGRDPDGTTLGCSR